MHSEINDDPQKRPFIDISIHRQKFKALIDSGASISAVNEQHMRNLILQYGQRAFPVAKTSVTITNANGGDMAPSEIRKVPIQLPNNGIAFIDLLVVKNLNCPVILGMNFLKQNKVIIDCATNKVSFPRNVNAINAIGAKTMPPPEMAIPLLAKETFAIQPFCLATTNAAISPADKMPDFAGAGAVDGDETKIMNGIVQVHDNCSAALKIINTDYEPRYIHKGDILGHISPLNNASKYIEIQSGDKGPQGLMSPDAFNCLLSITERNNMIAAKHNNPHKICSIRPSPGTARPPQMAVLNSTSYPKLRKSPSKPKPSMSKLEFLKKNLRVKAPEEYQKLYWQLIDEFQDVFSETETDLGLTPTLKHSIKLDTERPVHVKQFTIPFSQRPFIKQKVKDLLVQGIIERSNSNYNTPIFAIPKKPVPGQPQGYRLIQDLRRINDHTMLDKFTLQDIKDCIDKVGTRNATVFSSLDLTAGFFQIELDVDSRKFTAFTIPGDGQYQWTRVCLGLHGAPSTFAKLMSLVMKDLAQAMVYLDDVLCASTDHISHITDLRQCLLRLRQHKLKLNPFKTELGASSVQYLGYTVTKDGITTSDNKHEAIRDFPVPTSKKQIRQFVGLANFYRQLIPGFHKLAGVLTGLTKTLSNYRGGPLPQSAYTAFCKLKQKLCAKPVVAFPNPNLPFTLATDASSGEKDVSGGLGAVLTQKVNGKERTIAYASRALKESEKNYSAFLLEKLAITWAIEHFSVYLKDTRFEVITDHRPIEKLSTVHKKTLDRLHELMNQHECTIRYRPGSLNQVADALSRNAIDAFVTDDTANKLRNSLGTNVKIQEFQAQDPLCQAIIQFFAKTPITEANVAMRKIAAPYAPYCSVHDGVLVIFQHSHANTTRPLIVLPKRFHHEVIKQAHCSQYAGHQSAYKTTFRVQEKFWWPSLASDVKEFCKTCITCQMAQDPYRFHTTQAPLHPLPVPDAPNHRVHADLFGPLLETHSGNKWILVITDAFSKYTNLIALPNKEATTVTRAIFEHWICTFGPMKQLLTDNGKEFANNINKELCTILNIKRSLTSSIHPQTNASAESFNKWIIHYFKHFPLQDEKDWESYLGPAKIAYNTSVHDASNNSPFFLTFARDPNSLLFNWDPPNFDPNLYPHDVAAKLKEAFAHVTQVLESNRKKMIMWQKSAKHQNFATNQNVLIYYPKETFTGKGRNAKFVPNWQAGIILKQLTDVAYKVKLNKTNRTFSVHINRLKPLISAEFDENLPLGDPSNKAALKQQYGDQKLKHWPALPPPIPLQDPTLPTPSNNHTPQAKLPTQLLPSPQAPTSSPNSILPAHQIPLAPSPSPKQRTSKDIIPPPIPQSAPAANTRSKTKARSQQPVHTITKTKSKQQDPEQLLLDYCLWESFHSPTVKCLMCNRTKSQPPKQLDLNQSPPQFFHQQTKKIDAHMRLDNPIPFRQPAPPAPLQQDSSTDSEFDTASTGSSNSNLDQEEEIDNPNPLLDNRLSQSDQERSPEPDDSPSAVNPPTTPFKTPNLQRTATATPPQLSQQPLSREATRARILNFHNPTSPHLTRFSSPSPPRPTGLHHNIRPPPPPPITVSPRHRLVSPEGRAAARAAHQQEQQRLLLPQPHPQQPQLSQQPQQEALQRPPKAQATLPPQNPKYHPSQYPHSPHTKAVSPPSQQQATIPLALKRLLPHNISPPTLSDPSSSSSSDTSTSPPPTQSSTPAAAPQPPPPQPPSCPPK